MTLLTTKQVAAELLVTEEQVRALVRNGQLSFINVGLGKKAPRMRFDTDEVAAFKLRRTQTKGPPAWPRSISTRSQSSTSATSGSRVASLAEVRSALAAERQKQRQEKSNKS